MKITIKNAFFTLIKRVLTKKLFTSTHVMNVAQYPLMDGGKTYWVPSDNSNSLAVGNTIIGVECTCNKAGATFDVVLATFAQPSTETNTVDPSATLETLGTFTTSKGNGEKETFIFNPVTITNINQRIGVRQCSGFGWGNASQSYQYVNTISESDGKLYVMKYKYCSKLFFNLLSPLDD